MAEQEVNKQPDANVQQTQTGDQSKNNIPFVQAPIKFENKVNNVTDKFTGPTNEQIHEMLQNAVEKQKEETRKIQATQAQQHTDSFANVSGNVAVANNDSAWRATDTTGVNAVKSAQTAVESKSTSDQKLVDNAYERDLANQNAIAQTKNESLKLLNENYNTIQESFKNLGASADKSILDSERQLAETMRLRSETRQQVIDNETQYYAEVAALKGLGMSENMATSIGRSVANFTAKFDEETFNIFTKGQQLTSSLRQERTSINKDIHSLVTNYIKQKDELFLQAKQAENMAKYMVDGKSDYINSLKQDIIIKAKEKNIELQNKLYADVDARLSLANKALTSEVNRIENEKKVASSAIEQAIADGSIAHWTPEQKQKYAAMAGTTPAGVDNLRKASLAKVMSKLAVAGKKDLSIVDTMTSEVMKLTNAGVDLQDAIKQVAEQNGLSNEFNKLMYSPEAFNLDGITQITQDFNDQESAQNFANTIKDKYDDIKVVEKNGKWTITGKEKGTGKELGLKELITGSGVDVNTISGLSSSYNPSSSITQNSEVKENGQGGGSSNSTSNELGKQKIKNIEGIQIIKYDDLKEPTYLNESTSDELANLDNIVSNYEKRGEFLFKDIINKVSSEVEDRINRYKEEGIAEKRIKEKMRDEAYALFVNELNKYIGTSDQIGEEDKNIDEQKGILGKSLYHYLVKNNYINGDGLTIGTNGYEVFRGNLVRSPMIIGGNNHSELDSDKIRNIFGLK